MKFLLFLACIISSLFSFAQETKKIVIKSKTPAFTEEFYVLVDSPDIRHGEYVRTFNGEYGTSENGQYDRGKRVGIWQYKGFKGEIEQQIDFSNQKVILAKPLRLMTSSFIIQGDSLVENTASDLPLFLGGQSRISSYLIKHLEYPMSAKRVGMDGLVFVSAIVTKDGKLINEKVEMGLGYGLDEESIRVIQMLPDEWLPVGWGSQPQDCKVVFQIRYLLN